MVTSAHGMLAQGVPLTQPWGDRTSRTRAWCSLGYRVAECVASKHVCGCMHGWGLGRWKGCSIGAHCSVTHVRRSLRGLATHTQRSWGEGPPGHPRSSRTRSHQDLPAEQWRLCLPGPRWETTQWRICLTDPADAEKTPEVGGWRRRHPAPRPGRPVAAETTGLEQGLAGGPRGGALAPW